MQQEELAVDPEIRVSLEKKPRIDDDDEVEVEAEVAITTDSSDESVSAELKKPRVDDDEVEVTITDSSDEKAQIEWKEPWMMDFDEDDEEEEVSDEEKKRRWKEKKLRESWDSADFGAVDIYTGGLEENYCTDDEFYEPSSDTDRILYHQQIDKCQGYDVDYFPGTHPFWIQPIYNPHCCKVYTEFAMKAADVYNLNNKAQINFSKLVKANRSLACCAPTYITFEAKNAANGETETYQARVSNAPGGPDVEEVRKKLFQV